jgi:hypothetical protein
MPSSTSPQARSRTDRSSPKSRPEVAIAVPSAIQPQGIAACLPVNVQRVRSSLDDASAQAATGRNVPPAANVALSNRGKTTKQHRLS